MSNERLRAAIAKAGLELEQLAEMVQVDSKTVERWIAGRVPYTRHRTRVAKALGADAHELWPQAEPAAPVSSEEAGDEDDLLAAYPTGEALGVPDWQILLTGARERIDLLDTSLLDVVSVPGVIELLAAKAAAGCEIRIMLASSNGEWILRLDGTVTPQGAYPSTLLIEEIDAAHDHLMPLLGSRGVEIREYLEADPGSILRFDEQLLFSPNLWLTERPQAPMLHVTRREGGGLFDRLTEHFEAIWTQSEPPEPSDWQDDEEREHDREVTAPASPIVDHDGTESLLTDVEREQLISILQRWEVDAGTIADTLKHAVFSPGLAGLQSEHPSVAPGVAIMIDDQRDAAIAALFERRASQRDDREFLADWKIEGTRTRVLLAPDATDALIAYTIHITNPIILTRTYLLLASKGGQPLAWLAQPGTNVWLVPHQLAMGEWAKEGAGAGQDMYDRMLPLGEVLEPSLAIEAALTRIGHREG